MTEIQETAINIVGEGTRIEGEVLFDRITRVHGVLVGKVRAKEGSTLILGETAVVEGDVSARKKVVISRTGRVIGDIHSPSVRVEFGAYFEGRCAMESPAPA